MQLANATVLVTGANRGIGRAFVLQALARGASRVYAGARRPDTIEIDDPRVVPIRLDITDPATIDAAVATASDVDVLINNAGITTYTGLVHGDRDAVRRELDVNFWGTLDVTRAFAPVLGSNGGGAIVNMLSLLSFRSHPDAGGYAASKAAERALTDSTRLELAAQGTQVTGVFVAAVDTDMMAGYDGPKSDPADVARQALDAVESGAQDVLADADTRAAKALLSEPSEVLYAPFAG